MLCRLWRGKRKAAFVSVYSKPPIVSVIEIANNGPVILPEMQEKIFVPFFTTKAEGSGIGLSLCRQILRLHKGHLFVKESSSEQDGLLHRATSRRA